MSLIVAFMAFAPGLVVVVATVVKLREFWLASRYRSVPGSVITSKVESRPGHGMNRKPVHENFAKIVYEYEVNGRKWRAERVSVGEEKGNVGVLSTLEKYPKGSQVTVFYDPRSPAKAVLERELPPGFAYGMLIAIAFFFGGPLLLMVMFTELPQRIANMLPRPENALLVVVLGVLSVFLTGMAIALAQEYRRERRFVAAIGRVASSTAVPYETIFLNRPKTMYRAHIVYEYKVGDRAYRSSNLTSNVDVSRGSAKELNAVLSKYPVGSELTVYHDSAEPSIAVLSRPWGLPLVAAALAVIAISATIRLAV